MSSARQPRRGTPSGHPVMLAEPEMVDAGDGSDLDVAIQTTREGEWIEWSGPICWIPGEDGGSL